MEEKRSVFVTALATILAFSATAIIMFQVDPYQAGLLEKITFFASFLIGLIGLIKIIFRKYLW